MEVNTREELRCVCCGQPVEASKLLLDPVSCTISKGLKSIRFSRQQFNLASFLIKRFPMAVTKEDIYDQVIMSHTGEGPNVKIVDTLICKIRPYMAEVDLIIETVWGSGYRLVEGESHLAEMIKDASLRARTPGAARSWSPEHDAKLLDLLKRKISVAQCAAIMRMPYATIERHKKILQPIADRANSTIG